MKILLCDIEFDYGVKKNGINYIGRAFENAFKAEGHEVVPLYYDAFLKEKQPSPALQQLLIKTAAEVRPDMIFFPLFTNQYSMVTLDELKEKYLTVGWFGDDTWRFDNYSVHYAPHFTWCVTIDKFSLAKYRAIGQKNVVLCQWAAIDNENASLNSSCEYLYDISFVGQFNRYRKWFIERIEKSGFKVECFGRGWENGSLSPERMVEVFQKSRISLNLSNSISHDIRFLFSHPVDFLRYFFIRKTMGGIKARTFEVPYYGGFQLVEYFPGMEDYFDIGSEIACYKDVDEALMLVRYYLENECLRCDMTKKAHKKAKAMHGYRNRVREIIEAVTAK